MPPHRHVVLPTEEARSLFGDPPDGVSVTIWDATGEPPPEAERASFWVPPYLVSVRLAEVLPKLPNLEVVQLTTAGADAYIGRLPTGITLCDGRGIHGSSTAEWVLTAILASLRSFPTFVLAQREQQWARQFTDDLADKRVLVVGAGDVGDSIRRRLEPFEVEVTMVARSARPGVRSVDELPDLLGDADVVVVVVPLTDATRGLIDAEFLAAMKDGALIVNAARGQVAVTDALVAELGSGRLRAAVDVTDPEPLPAGHPLWSVPGLLLTPHVGGAVRAYPRRAFTLVRRQVERWAAGEALENVVTGDY